MTVPAPAPPVTDNVKVRLTAPGSWIFPHVAVPIRVDGQQVAEGSVKKGFDVVVELSVGTHRVEVAKSAHQLDLWEEGCCEVAFEYSRAWANYARPPRVRFIRPEEATVSWPAQLALEPPTVEPFDESSSAQDRAVLAELERLQNQQPSWWGALVTLAVSLLLYAAAARTQKLWDGIYLLIPVLAFHELGHYLTMLLATPLAFRLSRIAYRLGQEGLVARSPDAYSIPTESALQILAEVRRALPAQAAPKTLAQYVATVFETCNAEPPGAIASFGLLAAHAGGFLVALVMAIALTVFKNLPA